MGAKRIRIPESLLDWFAREPIIIIDPVPGLMPIDPIMLAKSELLERIGTEEFAQQFELIAVPKEMVGM